MIYSANLQLVGGVLGLGLLLGHGLALWRFPDCGKFLQAFPRSRVAGTILIALAGVWSFLLVWGMDLGEFARLRTLMLLAIAAGTFLAWRHVEEFLAVRALGMLAMLAAEPILEAAFLRPETSRLLVVVLAYAWIILGLFWVGMPWVLRDQIKWATAKQERLLALIWGGIVYGAVVLACAAFFWG